MELIEAIEQVEKKYYRTASDTGAHSNALLVQNTYRTLAGLPVLTRTALRQKEVDGYKAIMADAFLAGDMEKANRYKGYAQSALAQPIRTH